MIFSTDLFLCYVELLAMKTNQSMKINFESLCFGNATRVSFFFNEKNGIFNLLYQKENIKMYSKHEYVILKIRMFQICVVFNNTLATSHQIQ